VRLNGNNNVLTNCDAKYLSHFTKFSNGGSQHGDAEEGGGISIGGNYNAVRMCEIANTAASGVFSGYGSQGNEITRCNIHHIDYSGTYGSPIALAGTAHRVTFNTCHTCGRSIIAPQGIGHDIRYNDLFDPGLMCRDLGIIYAGYQDGSGTGTTHIAYNWVHDYLLRFNTATSNGIYLDSYNRHFTVDHNVLHHNSVVGFADGIASACIGDLPPANQGEVDSNFCHAVPSTVNNVAGIAMGGSDISITNNFVEGCSTAGIGVIVGSAGPAKGIKVIGNTTKNNNQANFGPHGGIELFLGPGGANLAGVSDVIVQGNHSYDDQPVKTQAYGITVALVGNQSPYANVIIEGNDVTGNKMGGILNNASSFTGFVIRNNAGFNPLGAIPAPAFPASATALINDTGYDATVYITSGTNSITIAIGGTTLTGVSVAGGGAVSGPIRLPANQKSTLTYAAGGTPSWQWIAD